MVFILPTYLTYPGLVRIGSLPKFEKLKLKVVVLEGLGPGFLGRVAGQ